MYKPLCFISAAIFFLSGCAPASVTRVCIRKACVTVEVADTPEETSRGLMFRKHLPDGQGMLFVFSSPSRYGFWMKNMEIPLDFVWIDPQKKIVSLDTGVMPCTKEPCLTIRPREPVQYVLEVNSGFIARHDLHIGDQVIFR